MRVCGEPLTVRDSLVDMRGTAAFVWLMLGNRSDQLYRTHWVLKPLLHIFNFLLTIFIWRFNGLRIRFVDSLHILSLVKNS